MNWYLDVFKNFADFSGRARRKEFWMFTLFNTIFLFVTITIDVVIGAKYNGIRLPFGFFTTLYFLISFIPSLAVTVRRLHDIEYSGWFYLITLIPLVGGIWLLILMVSDSKNSANKYGQNPKKYATNDSNIITDNTTSFVDDYSIGQTIFGKSAVIYGLYLGSILVLFSVILYISGLLLNQKIAYISIVLIIVGIIYAQISYRNKEMKGYISYEKALDFGVVVVLSSGVITAIFNLVLYVIIDPSLIEQMKIAQEDALVQKGLTSEQIEAAMSMSSKMITPAWISIMGLFGSVFMGTIISLITSIFVKKQASEDAFDEAMSEVKTEE